MWLDFKSSTCFYAQIIPHDSAVDLSVARRKYLYCYILYLTCNFCFLLDVRGNGNFIVGINRDCVVYFEVFTPIRLHSINGSSSSRFFHLIYGMFTLLSLIFGMCVILLQSERDEKFVQKNTSSTVLV